MTTVIEQVRNSEKPQIKKRLYKDPRMQAVYKHDGRPFFGKCAYCEDRIVSTQPGDIEHYRPKGCVTNEDGSRVMVDANGGKKVPHPGYYWLAYEWTNLLYACIGLQPKKQAETWRRLSRKRERSSR